MIALHAGSVSAETTIGNISHAGTGCSANGSVQVRVGSNGTRLLVYTPDMQVELNSKRLDRKACSIAIPVGLAPNERLVIGRPSVFGSERLGAGTVLTASAEVFLAGSAGPQVTKEVIGSPGHSLHNFYNIGGDSIVTGCGEQFILRANGSLLGRKTRITALAGGEAELRGMAFDIQLEECESN